MPTGLDDGVISQHPPHPADVAAAEPCASRGGLATLDDAVELLLETVPEPRREIIRLEAAAGRRLAAPVRAVRDRPARALSAMDGYAIQGCDPPAQGRVFRIVGAAYPGAPFDGSVGPEQAVRVTTGAPVPPGADRVVVDEGVDILGCRMAIVSQPGPKSNLRLKGSDFREGDCLVPAGARLSATTLMAAAACEADVVTVAERPRVVLVSTGGELARPGQPMGDHQIPDSISVSVAALLTHWGARIIRQDRSWDEPDVISGLLGPGGDDADADIVVVIGGASGSEIDRSRDAVVSSGARMLFQGIALKPGRPAWAARRGRQILVGLPGNPWAALVAARLLVAPVVALMESGSAQGARHWQFAPTLEPLGSGEDRDVILRAYLDPHGLRILSKQDSSSHSQLADLNAIVRRPPGCSPAMIGDPLHYLAF